MKENGSSGKSAGKVTAHALDWWRESTAGKLVAPVTCALYELTGSIWAGVLLHMIKNSLAFMVTFVLPHA